MKQTRGQKWSNQLAIQLGMLILATNLIVLLVCFFFQYGKVNELLLQKDELSNVDRFHQSEKNIERFVEQTDLVSRRLSVDTNLGNLSGRKIFRDVQQVTYVKLALAEIEKVQMDYSFIPAVSFYGSGGIVLKSTLGPRGINSFYQYDDSLDWDYATSIGDLREINVNKLRWIGGQTGAELGIASNEAIENQFYISAFREVLNGSGILVFHIDMDYFLEMFSSGDGRETESVYVMDQNFKIVAADDKTLIGTQRQFPEMENTDGISKYVMDGETGKNQVIVYELSSMGWYLVSETAIAEITKDNQYMRNILLISCIMSISASFILSMTWVSKMLRPLKTLDEKMQRVAEGQLGNVVKNPPKNELGAVTTRFNDMSLALKEMFTRNQIMEQEKLDLEMQTLRDQINPHMIYNVLNNIRWRAIFSNEMNIAQGITMLAKYLEQVFRNQSRIWTIREELEYVGNYIAIINLLRTGEYTLEAEVPEALTEASILRFILQPVVENAIMHGYTEKNSGRIKISVTGQDGELLIYIEDDGNGISEEMRLQLQRKIDSCTTRTGEGIGLVNVKRRIRNYYGADSSLHVHHAQNKGTVVTLKLGSRETDREVRNESI